MTKKSETIEEVKSQVKEQHIDPMIEKIGKCYSTERFADFQKAVKGIVLDVLGHDEGKGKIEVFVKDTTKKYIEEKSWNSKQFWIPTIISLLGLLLAAIAVYAAFQSTSPTPIS